MTVNVHFEFILQIKLLICACTIFHWQKFLNAAVWAPWFRLLYRPLPILTQYTSSDAFTPVFSTPDTHNTSSLPPAPPPRPSLPPTTASPWSLVTRNRTSYFHRAKERSPNWREDSSLRLILRPEQTASRSLTGSLLLWSSLNNSHVIGEFCQAENCSETFRGFSRGSKKHPRDQCPTRAPAFVLLSPLNLGQHWRHGTPVVLLRSGYHKKSLPRQQPVEWPSFTDNAQSRGKLSPIAKLFQVCSERNCA